MPEDNIFGCEGLQEELKQCLGSMGKLTDEEQARIMEFAKRIEHVARADGAMKAATSVAENFSTLNIAVAQSRS